MNLLDFIRDIVYEEENECIENYDAKKKFSHKGYLYTNIKRRVEKLMMYLKRY